MSNKEIAKRIRAKSRKVNDCLKELEDLGYIKRKIIYKPGTKQIEKRIITSDWYPGAPKNKVTPLAVECDTPLHQSAIPPCSGVQDPLAPQCDRILHTNTTFKSSSSTPTTKNGCEEKTQDQKSVSGNKQDSDSLNDPQHVSEVYNRWNDIWGKPSEAVEEAITKWVNEFGYEVVIHAINYAEPRLKDTSRAYGYLRSMMSNYHDHEVKTVADAEKADREYQTGSNKGQQSPWQQLPASNDQQARDIQKYSRHLLKKRRDKHKRIKEPMPAWSQKSQAELNKPASDADVAKLKERLANRKKAQEG